MGRLGNPMAVATVASSLSPNERRAIGIGALALIALGAYAGYRAYRKMLKGNNDEAEKGIKETIDKIAVDKSKTTIDSATAMNWAQQLFDAMNQRGTDNRTVFRIIGGIKNKHDFALVFKAFGAKHYGRWGESFLKNDLFSTPLDLFGWLKKEMSSSELEQLRITFDRIGVVF